MLLVSILLVLPVMAESSSCEEDWREGGIPVTCPGPGPFPDPVPTEGRAEGSGVAGCCSCTRRLRPTTRGYWGAEAGEAVAEAGTEGEAEAGTEAGTEAATEAEEESAAASSPSVLVLCVRCVR